MRFDAFSKIISKISLYELPGLVVQLQMAPPYRELLLKQSAELIDKAKLAAVLALFYPGLNGKTYLVFILRQSRIGVHSEQIGFPGGKPEKGDANLQQTAVRETHEEIGVNPELIELITPMSKLYIPPSNFNVFPFVGITQTQPVFKAQLSEVASIIEISLDDLIHPKYRTSVKVKTADGLSITVPAFNFSGHIVWGATAMILTEIIYLLNLILKK